MRAQTFTVDDPLAGESARRLAGLNDPAEQAVALLGTASIFPPQLATDARFQGAVIRQLQRITEHGASSVLTP